MTTDVSEAGPRRMLSWPVRAALGLAVGILIILAVLRIASAEHSTRSVFDSGHHISAPWMTAAIGFQLIAYCIPPLLLARLVADAGIRLPTAARIAYAALGVGNLVPGQPAPETLIAYRELHLRGVPRTRALTTPLVILVAIPASAMVLLAGPALLASAAGLGLPSGWRIPVLIAGAVAAVLGIGLVVVTISARARARLPAPLRADQILTTVGGPRGAAIVMLLALTAFCADGAALYAASHAVGAGVPLAALPVAYILAMAAIALPLLPGGLGAVEIAVPLVFTAAGASYSSAVLAVLAWRILQFWIPTVVGLCCYASLLIEQRRRGRVPPEPDGPAVIPRSPE